LYGEGVRNRLAGIDVATHGMTSQKKSPYGHSSTSSSSPFFLLGTDLRVASSHYFNPVSEELVGLFILLLCYCVYLLLNMLLLYFFY